LLEACVTPHGLAGRCIETSLRKRWSRKGGGRDETDPGTGWMRTAGMGGGAGNRDAASLAAVVFRGMLGGRFPRGLCYRLGRMTSPRYQILNLLAPAAYPRQDIQTVLPRTPRPTGHPNRPTAYTASPHRLPTPKPTPSTISLSLSLSLSFCLLLCLRCLFVQRRKFAARRAIRRCAAISYRGRPARNSFPAMLRRCNGDGGGEDCTWIRKGSRAPIDSVSNVLERCSAIGLSSEIPSSIP